MDDATLLRSFNFRITHFGEKSNYYISLTLFASNMTDNANSDSFLKRGSVANALRNYATFDYDWSIQKPSAKLLNIAVICKLFNTF